MYNERKTAVERTSREVGTNDKPRTAVQHYGVSEHTLYKWRRKAKAAGVTFPERQSGKIRRRNPPPWEELAEKWGEMTNIVELVKHYGGKALTQKASPIWVMEEGTSRKLIRGLQS